MGLIHSFKWLFSIQLQRDNDKECIAPSPLLAQFLGYSDIYVIVIAVKTGFLEVVSEQITPVWFFWIMFDKANFLEAEYEGEGFQTLQLQTPRTPIFFRPPVSRSLTWAYFLPIECKNLHVDYWLRNNE